MLSIQKVVVLLDEFHLREFRKHLEEVNAELPLRLVDAAKKIGWEEKDSDELCKAIYGKAGTAEKRKFFQLAHHTFKLTSFLSRNYPSYLLHNLPRIERLVNGGKLKQAAMLGEVLLDIAEKIEDFSTCRSVLGFFAQNAYMREKKGDAVRYHERIAEVIGYEKAVNDIYLYQRSNLHFKDKSALDREDTDSQLDFFRQYHQSSSVTVSVMARYASCYTLHFHNDDRFYATETLNELNTIVEEIEKSPYLVFTFSEDLELNIDYLKVKILVSRLSEEEMRKEALLLLKKRETPRFWRNYLNTAQIAFLSIEASVLISRYGFGYREGWNENLPADIKEQLAFCRKLSKEILNRSGWEGEHMHVRLINMNTLYCGFLLLGSKDDIKKVTSILEGLLFNYQQVSFHRMYDQIFAALIMAYFILAEYTKVQECYKRYEKLTAHSSKLPENDITIKAYYYVSQWLQSERKQYREKLDALLAKTEGINNLESARALLLDLKDYFKI